MPINDKCDPNEKYKNKLKSSQVITFNRKNIVLNEIIFDAYSYYIWELQPDFNDRGQFLPSHSSRI